MTCINHTKQVEVMVHMYVHDGAAAEDAVSTILLELIKSADTHVRVTALEIVVNTALRAQLLLESCSPDDLPHNAAVAHDEARPSRDQGYEHSADHLDQGLAHEHIRAIVTDLQLQLLRLIAWASEEEALDAHMCETAISSLLLMCTHNGQLDRLLFTHLPLEALCQLVTHARSNATVRHTDGLAHSSLLHILCTALHYHHRTHAATAHTVHESDRLRTDAPSPSYKSGVCIEDGCICYPPAWRETGTTVLRGGCLHGFEKRLRLVGGIGWVLQQVRAARCSSSRDVLYSIILRYLLVAALEARTQEVWCCEDQVDLLAEAAWDSACIEAVEVLHQCALPHALAQAVWVRAANFSPVLSGLMRVAFVSFAFV